MTLNEAVQILRELKDAKYNHEGAPLLPLVTRQAIEVVLDYLGEDSTYVKIPDNVKL